MRRGFNIVNHAKVNSENTVTSKRFRSVLGQNIGIGLSTIK